MNFIRIFLATLFYLTLTQPSFAYMCSTSAIPCALITKAQLDGAGSNAPGSMTGNFINNYNGAGSAPVSSMIGGFREDIIDTINDTNRGGSAGSDNLTFICDGYPDCTSGEAFTTRDEIIQWVDTYLWRDIFGPSLRAMTSQLINVKTAQTAIIGTFFDAQAHIEGQMLLQELRADAHHKYVPSRQLCTFATSVKSLAQTEQIAKQTINILNSRSMDRQMSGRNTIAGVGDFYDKLDKLRKFKSKYCDYADNDNNIEFVCRGITLPHNGLSINNDFNYNKILYSKSTLNNVNFFDKNITKEEEDIMALSDFLYNYHNNFEYPMYRLASSSYRAEIKEKRSIMAKRAVARNSFHNIIAKKAEGTSSSENLKNIIRIMSDSSGSLMNDAEIEMLIGSNPSYYAQMEILTKKLYQNSNFYVGLIDKPENIKRQHASIQAYRLMQNRDNYESFLRSEMLISILVENRLGRLHDQAEKKLALIK